MNKLLIVFFLFAFSSLGCVSCKKKQSVAPKKVLKEYLLKNKNSEENENTESIHFICKKNQLHISVTDPHSPALKNPNSHLKEGVQAFVVISVGNRAYSETAKKPFGYSSLYSERDKKLHIREHKVNQFISDLHEVHVRAVNTHNIAMKDYREVIEKCSKMQKKYQDRCYKVNRAHLLVGKPSIAIVIQYLPRSQERKKFLLVFYPKEIKNIEKLSCYKKL